MKSFTHKILFNFALIAGTASTAFSSTPFGPLPEPLIIYEEYKPNEHHFKGLTAAGRAALIAIRDEVRLRDRLFNSEFLGMGTLWHMIMVNRLFKGNAFLYGPPGGGKSAAIDWFLDAEEKKTFRLQMHQMLSPQAITGGQNFDDARKGEFKISTKGSIVEFITAVLDEIDKMNPALAGSFMSFLNERIVRAGGQDIEAATESVFATSNANLPEILEQFMQSGQGTTGPAFLNRFQFKAFVYNWLSPKDQATLDKRQEKKRLLSLVRSQNREVALDPIFLKPGHLDWKNMRILANALIKQNDEYFTAFREFSTEMRLETNKAIKESQAEHLNNRLAEPFVYFPSFDPTERLRLQIAEVVRTSAFIDFLLSDLADDDMLDQWIRKPIELGADSLWRSYLVMTTVGPGETKLVLDEDSDNKLKIQFGFNIDENSARDTREELLIKNLKDEQRRFSKVFQKRLDELKEQIKIALKYDRTSGSGHKIPFELRILKK